MGLSEREQCLQESLQDLREDVFLLRAALLGSRTDGMDGLALACLLRLCDYLRQHVDDVCALCALHKGFCPEKVKETP